MADEWNPGTSYSPGAVVTYRGYVYERSAYPPTATSATPPNQEMSVDSKGVAIRTWTIQIPAGASASARFVTAYFRLIEPPFNSTSPTAEFSYSGPQFLEGNAYGTFGDTIGTTVEIDQAKTNPSPIPDSPVCPANLCGVALQQGAEGVVQCDVAAQGDTTDPLKYYIYVLFNHPLYFRRSISVLTRILRIVTVYDPPSVTETYENTITMVTPTDKNYCSIGTGGSYYVPANAAFDITVPADVITDSGSTVYVFAGAALSQVEAND